MGRKLFLRHVADAAAAPPPEISHVEKTDEDVIGFRFHYAKDGLPRECNICLLALDIHEYPDGNNYIVYTEQDAIDPDLPKAFEILTPLILGKSILEALQELSRGLTETLTHGQQNNPIALNGDSDHSDADDFLAGEDFDDEAFGLGDAQPKLPSTNLRAIKAPVHSSTSVSIEKIRHDLLVTKDAGFRIGVLGNLSSGGIVCVSIRVSKLGISEEAMQAWGLSRKHYLVLLVRFQQGYRELSEVKADTILSGKTEMRVALCDSYKPSSNDAFAAFNQVDQPQTVSTEAESPLEPLFIGRPLNDLLRERFTKIVSFRESCGFNWPSAEAFVHEVQGKSLAAMHTNIDDFVRPDDANKTLGAIVRADHLEGKLLKDASLPLVAMQFVLRHFVRCTEFCLVCHCKVGDTFEALKPYVCSQPLCSYQYMALGFGPSIEWELLSQPYVVDLLVSFCYAAAKQGRLKHFPVGINLRVPHLPHYINALANYRVSPNTTSGYSEQKKEPIISKPISGRLDSNRSELIIENEQLDEAAFLRVGDWVIVRSKDVDDDLHYRIVSAMFPTLQLSAPLRVSRVSPTVYAAAGMATSSVNPATAPSLPTTPPKSLPVGVSVVECFPYKYGFDDLPNDARHHALVTLLDTLPSVLEMQQYLQVEQKGKDLSLRTWRSHISDSALNLLRWIIASNRSCIMQVDHLVQDKAYSKLAQAVNDRVAGMDDWMQFRFAQGAPDKEQRFVDCLKQEIDGSGKKYPTFFAWHGSPLSNWHSIIRQGLRFDETLHGRAFGHGVYMAREASTSVGYANNGGYSASKSGVTWPQSALRVSQAFSLNEVVNVPEKFVSKSPYYVVNNIDWIQTRYLFVKSDLVHTVGEKPSTEYQQDPTLVAKNDRGVDVHIPITAVSKSRRPTIAQAASKTGDKKSKSTMVTDQETAEKQEDDANSLLSDDDDRALLEPELDDVDAMSLDGEDFYDALDSTPTQAIVPSKKRGFDASQTDFVPGTLDVSNVKFFDPPKDASSSGTKALMGWFKEAVKVQESTPLHKLGWYINPDHISNMYQWIVELHSFNEKLPLSKDMKEAGVKSIVLEMRFTNQFPFSPPFIRVVRPRFLPFNQGGGGHVTEGGAICMELLTNNGWSAVTALEAVLLQVQVAMSDEERPARLLNRRIERGGFRYHGSGREDSYAIGEAVAAYERACRAHGWQVPVGFNKFHLEEGAGV